ncbi:MAG: hypothetical protein P8K08_19035 [Fuerstiella sp.]|jgi:hypothetical protein|nr:hypothetical protein [Fuerstiella sp.]
MSHPVFMPREEYIEQEYFFRVYRERLEENVPSQDILKTVHEEILSTTRLPMAVDFMRAEILHSGRISDAMVRLPHYFTPFQSFVIARAEDDVSRFEQITGLQILEREAKYRAGSASMSGSFVYQFECIVRNRLGYGDGLRAMANDPCFDKSWKTWINDLNNKLGANELSEIVYRASEHFLTRRRARMGTVPETPDNAVALFGEQEGRIARANIGRDPMCFFAALQRQLNYPQVPLSRKVVDDKLSPFLESRLVRLEQRLKIVEMEQKGGIDLTKFYKKENDSGNGNGALEN